MLASVLKDTSFHLNNTVGRVRREVSYRIKLPFSYEETFILISLRFYFAYGKITVEHGFKYYLAEADKNHK